MAVTDPENRTIKAVVVKECTVYSAPQVEGDAVTVDPDTFRNMGIKGLLKAVEETPAPTVQPEVQPPVTVDTAPAAKKGKNK